MIDVFMCHSDYMCPEMILGERRYNARAIDVWGLGIILYIMVAGQMPFEVKRLKCWHGVPTKYSLLPSTLTSGLMIALILPTHTHTHTHTHTANRLRCIAIMHLCPSPACTGVQMVPQDACATLPCHLHD